MSDFEQLVRASRLYYELGETQHTIAELLGVTRPQVSRILKRARAEGIVEIRIHDSTAAESPAAEDAPPAVRARCRAPRAVGRGPRGPDPADGRPARGRGRCATRSAAARSSASATGRRCRPRPTPWTRQPARSPRPSSRSAAATGRPARSASRTAASPRRSTPRPRGLMAPGLVDDAATRRSLVAHAGVQVVLDLWERLDVALFGIGGPAWSSVGRRRSGRAPARDLRRRRRGARRPVRHRRAVRLPGPAGPGHRLRCPPARAACRSPSAWRRARPRSGRSSAPCGPASFGRS